MNFQQRPIGNPDDLYSRGAHEAARLALVPRPITPPEQCVGCGKILLADAEVVFVNNMGSACNDACAAKAQSR